MTKESLRLALEALEDACGDRCNSEYNPCFQREAITAIKEALANEALEKMAENARELGLDYEPPQPEHGWTPERIAGMARLKEAQDKKLAQPEFIKHEVKNADDWSEWVCPDPKNYLMKCCDCGLVHEAEFGVVRYKSETERDDCDMVDDSNLQAVFRMRRSEEWTPEDTAHRSGGLPMAQTEQHQDWCASLTQMLMSMPPKPAPCNCKPKPEQPKVRTGNCLRVGVCASEGHKIAPQRTWVGLTDDEIVSISADCASSHQHMDIQFARAIESKLKEKNVVC